MTKRTLSKGAFGVALITTAIGIGCSANTAPYPGGLMVAVQTDLVAPKDVTAVGLFISSDGRPVFSDTRDTAPNGEVHFPATIAVIADENRPGAVIKIRAVAFTSDNKVRVLRDALTTVPRGRTGLLRMPLLWINEGSGTGSRTDVAQAVNVRIADTSLDTLSNVKSTCTDSTQTYIDGECKDANVDSASLPDYEEPAVFGGGHADGTDGSCFDVKACFSSAKVVSVDASCVVTLGAGQSATDPNLSLAVALKQVAAGANASTGECLGNGVCLVPLDKDADWTAKGNTIQLPPALCKRIDAGAALGIVATFACPAKTNVSPSCGPASAVTSDHPVTPDGGADGPSSIDFDAQIVDAALDVDVADTNLPIDAGVDGTIPDTGIIDATIDAIGLDAGASDATVLDAGATDATATDATLQPDAAPPGDFGPPSSYTIQMPDPSYVKFDGQRVYVARSQLNTHGPNVVSYLLSDLIANPGNPAFPVDTLFVDSDTIGTPSPFFDIRYSGTFPIGVTGVYEGPPWTLIDCALRTDGNCSATGPLLAHDTSTYAVGPLAATPARFYVTRAGIQTVDYYEFSTQTWGSFAVPTQYQVTAMHYMPSVNTLIIGLASGEIYRCTDAPCTASNGTFYSLAPTGGAVQAITDDGTLMYWDSLNLGIFKEDAIAPIPIVAGPLTTTNTTSLSLDSKYIYYPDASNVWAARIDGSAPTAPTNLAITSGTVTSVVSAADHVFYTTTPSPGSLGAACKRFVNPSCN